MDLLTSTTTEEKAKFGVLYPLLVVLPLFGASIVVPPLAIALVLIGLVCFGFVTMFANPVGPETVEAHASNVILKSHPNKTDASTIREVMPDRILGSSTVVLFAGALGVYSTVSGILYAFVFV